MKKIAFYSFLLAIMLFNAFMVHSLKHDRLPFLNTKSVEAMAWEEMINPNWSYMGLFRADCDCLSSEDNPDEILHGETLQCSYYALPPQYEPCGDNQHGLDRCYSFLGVGLTSLCDRFIWRDADGMTEYYHPSNQPQP